MLRGGGIGSDAGSSLTQTVEETAQTDTESEAVEDGESADANDSNVADADVENADATETDVTETDGGNTADESAADDGGAATYSAESGAATYADGDVACVGDGACYATVDEAIDAASAGATITLLADVTAGRTFYKSLTFTGGYTLTVDAYSWRYSGDLVFDDANFEMVMDGESPAANNGEIASWLGMAITDGSLVARNGANVTFSFDSEFGVNCAIYGTRSDIIVENGSTLSIYGKNTKGVLGQGLQLDSPGTVGISVTGGSTFLIDGTNRGYVCSPDIYVKDSTFIVQNCTANASNGGKFTAVNSTIQFTDNAGHGLSAGNVVLNKSKVTTTGNGYCGFVLTGNLEVKNSSVITVTDNAWQDNAAAYAGMRLNGGSTSRTYDIDSTTTLTINDNYNTGLDVRRGTLTIEDGAKVEITGNSVNNTSMAGYGGGIYVGYSTLADWAKVIIPADVLICNNHALNGGDDIYVATGAEGARSSLTIMPVQDGQSLDGIRLTSDGDQDSLGSVEDDCTESIDGWYFDGMDEDGALDADKRWEAHAESYDDVYAELYDIDAVTTVEGPIALKAAHGIGSAKVSLDVTKVLEGAALADSQFEFLLTADDGETVVATGTNDADGVVGFDMGDTEYNEVATYAYQVSEVNDGQDGITYDDTVYDVTVDVVWDGEDACFTADVTVDGMEGDSIAFTNTYVAPAEPEEPAGEETPTEEETPTDTTDTTADGKGDEIAKTGASLIVPAVVVVLLLAVAAAGMVLRRRANR